MGILGNIFRKIFLEADADYRKIKLIDEQVNLQLEKSEVKKRILLAERQLKEDLKAAKGDSKKEAAAYRKCREAYKNSGYKKMEDKKKDLIHREVMNHTWERM